MGKKAFAPDGKIDTALLIFWKCSRLCVFCLMRKKHCWNYGRSGLDWTKLIKFFRSDKIGFNFFRSGLES